MDGIATVGEISRLRPRLPVIMCSSLTRRGALTTLDALAAGARDYITKPELSAGPEQTIAHFQRELAARIKVLCGRGNRRTAPADRPSPPSTDNTMLLKRRQWTPELVCIGVSTGGPNALEDLFRGFPEGFPVTIVIVQHMPPVFTRLLAERLDKVGGVRFHEGQAGQRLEAGHACIAPGGRHMTVERTAHGLTIQLSDDPPEHSCRPAADVLFRSVEAACGGQVLAVVLTGMGHDGRAGCAGLKIRGAHVIAQDETTSVVWGMPGAVVRAGLANEILPLEATQAAILRRVN
jgi:two-component system chemotaxis response regulator CheB